MCAIASSRAVLLTLAASCCLAAATGTPSAQSGPKAAEKHPVSDTYHGIKVVDDYRWLEDWDDPQVKQWSAAENTRTRGYLDALPARQAIRTRVEQLIGESVAYYGLQFRAGTLFAM